MLKFRGPFRGYFPVPQTYMSEDTINISPLILMPANKSQGSESRRCVPDGLLGQRLTLKIQDLTFATGFLQYGDSTRLIRAASYS